MILFSRRWLLKVIAALPLMPRLSSSVDLSKLRAIANHVTNAPSRYFWEIPHTGLWGNCRSGMPSYYGLDPTWNQYRWARSFR